MIPLRLQVIGGERCGQLLPVPRSTAPTDQAVSAFVRCMIVRKERDLLDRGGEYSRVHRRST